MKRELWVAILTCGLAVAAVPAYGAEKHEQENTGARVEVRTIATSTAGTDGNTVSTTVLQLVNDEESIDELVKFLQSVKDVSDDGEVGFERNGNQLVVTVKGKQERVHDVMERVQRILLETQAKAGTKMREARRLAGDALDMYAFEKKDGHGMVFGGGGFGGGGFGGGGGFSGAFGDIRLFPGFSDRFAYAKEDRERAGELDKQSRELAEKYRETKDEAEKEKLSKELRPALDELFDLKTKGYSARITSIEKELDNLRTKVKEREENKKFIVTSRFKELIGEYDHLKW